jgi:hypothetical protein
VTTVPPSSKNLLGCQIHSENTGKYIVNGDSFYTFEKHQVDIQMIFIIHPNILNSSDLEFHSNLVAILLETLWLQMKI